MPFVKLINTPGNKVREYLAGDVLEFLQIPLDRAKTDNGSVLMALYELQDKELVKLISGGKSRVHIILANSSKGTPHGDAGEEANGNGGEDQSAGKVWDAGNAPARTALEGVHMDIQN